MCVIKKQPCSVQAWAGTLSVLAAAAAPPGKLKLWTCHLHPKGRGCVEQGPLRTKSTPNPPLTPHLSSLLIPGNVCHSCVQHSGLQSSLLITTILPQSLPPQRLPPFVRRQPPRCHTCNMHRPNIVAHPTCKPCPRVLSPARQQCPPCWPPARPCFLVACWCVLPCSCCCTPARGTGPSCLSSACGGAGWSGWLGLRQRRAGVTHTSVSVLPTGSPRYTLFSHPCMCGVAQLQSGQHLRPLSPPLLAKQDNESAACCHHQPVVLRHAWRRG